MHSHQQIAALAFDKRNNDGGANSLILPEQGEGVHENFIAIGCNIRCDC
jgi:hypothetical protein